MKKLFTFGLIFSVLLAIPGLSQEPQPRTKKTPITKTEIEAVKNNPPSPSKEESLLKIVTSISTLKKEIVQKQAELKSPASAGIREEITGQVQALSSEVNKLKKDINEIITEVEISSSIDPTAQDFSWSQELRDLLSPLINEVKQITARPREIDALRNNLNINQEKLQQSERALENIAALKITSSNPLLEEYIADIKEDWKNARSQRLTQISITKQKLNKKIGNKKPLSESVTSIFEVFFKSRGRNLFVSLLIVVIFILGMRKFYASSKSLVSKRDSTRKVLQVVYMLTLFLGSIAIFMFCLFFFEDWVLLILTLLFLLGLIWATKETLPQYWNQAVVLLNMGPVREKERVLIKDIPWRVKNLNFYSILENPELTGGILRLPLIDLLEMRSRYNNPQEPWFPTKKNQWVILSDERYGKILLQTPEMVQLSEIGGSIVSYQTNDFLGLNPKVLSEGFRLKISFGFDYQHQEIIVSDIAPTLQKHIIRELEATEFNREKINISCEFEAAGASSLNIAVIADCPGIYDSKYQALSRLLQKLCVAASNQYGWIIPFDQLTLHVATDVSESQKTTIQETLHD